MKTLYAWCLLSALLVAQDDEPGADIANDESRYYTIEHYTAPDGETLEVGGVAWMSDGRMLVSTRRGRVWAVENALADDIGEARFSIFADGLHEGLGLHVEQDPRGDRIYVVQRGELTQIADTDGDGRADTFRTISDDWGLSGNYHEFAFGLPKAADGRLYVGLNVGFFDPEWWHGRAQVPGRGTIVAIDPTTGETERIALGLRSPCGLGVNAAGDLFATDNQGDWMPVGPIVHVKPGRFFGHPGSLRWTDEYLANDIIPSDTLPPDRERADAAVWLPYGWSRSPGNLVADTTGGRFGSFDEQMFLAELTLGAVLRVQLETVRGEYQGAVFPFLKDVGSVVRVSFAPDGSLVGGLTNRGWGGLAPADGLTRIRWTGETPLEIERVHLLQGGFELTFTEAVDASTLNDVELIQYDYDWWWEYGSPERRTTRVDVESVSVSDDGLVATVVAPLVPAMVARMTLNGVRGVDGEALLHDEFAYTINQLPEGPLTTEHVAKEATPPPPKASEHEGWLRLSYGDALDAWNAEGWALVNAALAEDATTFDTEPGNNALVNVDHGPASDYVSRYAFGDGTVHVEFMLADGAATSIRVHDRYEIMFGDARAPNGGIVRADATVVRPVFDVALEPGVWSVVDIEFEAPRFDAAGRRTSPARFARVTVDGVVVHEDIVFEAPNVVRAAGELPAVADAAGVDDRRDAGGERPYAPLVITGTRGPVGLRTLMFRPRGDHDGMTWLHEGFAGLDAKRDAGDGWAPLFNGESLEGWRTSPGADDDAWLAEDGVIYGEGEASHLFSPRGDYADVAFRAEVRINDGGNSGMYVRAAYGGGWPAGYEAQVNASHGDAQRSGSIYSRAPVRVQLVQPGTWFRQQFRCRTTPAGTRLTTSIGGVVVADVLDTSDEHARGHITLQQHHEGSEVEYRRLEVREWR